LLANSKEVLKKDQETEQESREKFTELQVEGSKAHQHEEIHAKEDGKQHFDDHREEVEEPHSNPTENTPEHVDDADNHDGDDHVKHDHHTGADNVLGDDKQHRAEEGQAESDSPSVSGGDSDKMADPSNLNLDPKSRVKRSHDGVETGPQALADR